MAAAGTMSTLFPLSSLSAKSISSTVKPSNYIYVNAPKTVKETRFSSTISTTLSTIPQRQSRFHENPFTAKAASSSAVGSTEYMEEPATSVKFQRTLSLPGCSNSLSLLGTGYREKVFAIIGVKVYAAALYVNQSIFAELDPWKGHSAAEVQQETGLFNAIYQAASEKSLHIVLVRDVDGKTFWDALDEAISPRIQSPTSVDSSALSTFRKVFQDRPLKKGTSIFLTWLDPTKMLVSISNDGIPSKVDATIESKNVSTALFDVFLGANPVSPTLKASVANGLATILN